jgi:ribosomal protein S18 acetylase RimI-like enzyme
MTAVTRPSVRAATVRDAAELAAIHVRSWQAAYRGLLPQDYLDELDVSDGTERWRRTLRATDWSRSGVMVAEPGPELLGFARFGPTRDGDDDADETGQIRAIYVIPEAWGKGFGKRLMSMALARLMSAGYSEATLWVLPSNTRARRFYEAGGWVHDGTTKCDDSRGFPIPEIRYRKQLASLKACAIDS